MLTRILLFFPSNFPYDFFTQINQKWLRITVIFFVLHKWKEKYFSENNNKRHFTTVPKKLTLQNFVCLNLYTPTIAIMAVKLKKMLVDSWKIYIKVLMQRIFFLYLSVFTFNLFAMHRLRWMLKSLKKNSKCLNKCVMTNRNQITTTTAERLIKKYEVKIKRSNC